MEKTHWTAKLHTIPHRILDHPFSGAYALWILLANTMLSNGTSGSATQLTSAASLSVLTLTLTAGRKKIIHTSVMRKIKQISHVRKNLSIDKVIREKGLAQAFEALYSIGNIYLVKCLADSVHEIEHNSVTSWGFSPKLELLTSASELAGNLIDGALYHMLVKSPTLSGILPKAVQRYLLTRHPEWVAEYPTNFSPACVEQAWPGLMSAALTVYSLGHDTEDRRTALAPWLCGETDPTAADIDCKVKTPIEQQNFTSTIEM
jgi:hypothetical protein